MKEDGEGSHAVFLWVEVELSEHTDTHTHPGPDVHLYSCLPVCVCVCDATTCNTHFVTQHDDDAHTVFVCLFS